MLLQRRQSQEGGVGLQVKPAEWIEMMLYLITPGGGRTATKEARAEVTWMKHGREQKRLFEAEMLRGEHQD